MHVANASRSQIEYRWQDARSTCILDETVLTRDSTFAETDTWRNIALPGSGTMRGEWARSAPPRSKTLGYRSLEQSSITIQTPRMATDALYRFYFPKYRPCWRRPVHAPAWGSTDVAARFTVWRIFRDAGRRCPVFERFKRLYKL